MNESPQVAELYDNLTPWREDGDQVYVVNKTAGPLYLTVAVASEPGLSGGPRLPTALPRRLLTGLNRVSASWIERIEIDAARQDERGGGVLADALATKIEIVRSLAGTKPAKVAEWLLASADIGLVAELRGDPKHGAAAERAFAAWHSREASDATKTLRGQWASVTGSRKVA